MLKEFIAHIQDTTKAQILEIGESTFAVNADGGANEIRPMIDHPDTLPLTSLDALVKLVRSEASGVESPLYITIPDHLTVRCFGRSAAKERFHRQVYYEVRATDVPGFRDGFREQGKAIIELRSQFMPNEGTEYLLDLLSRISKESAVTSRDNGVSQEVEARQGIALSYGVKVKPIVPLRPYRTFQEVDQPESDFLLRLDGDGNIGLFEADGGMWKLRARETVKAFLEAQLAEEVSAGAVIAAL